MRARPVHIHIETCTLEGRVQKLFMQLKCEYDMRIFEWMHISYIFRTQKNVFQKQNISGVTTALLPSKK